MTEYQLVFRRQLKWMLNILAVFLVGWGLTDYKEVFISLVLGTTFSFYFLWSMYYKINQFGQAVVDQKRAKTLGSLQRYAIAGLAVLIAMRFPETFHLISVVLGLMTFYIVIMIDFFIQSLLKSGKRGD